jgi:hypothetical protein
MLAGLELKLPRKYREIITGYKIVILADQAMPEVAVDTPPQLHHVVGHDLKRKEGRAVMHSVFSIGAASNGGRHGHRTRNG